VRSRRRRAAIGSGCLAALVAGACDIAGNSSDGFPATLRIATFNIQELSTVQLSTVDGAGTGLDPQAVAATLVIREARPDVLVLNEIDFDWERPGDPAVNARRFVDAYLAVGPDPLDYPYVYSAPVNTGILSGLDLNGDGMVATEADRGTREHGDDSFGYGTYPGQYGMAVLSRYPLAAEAARTFQRFRWVDFPGHHMPPGHLTAEAEESFRLSSKSHWDLPVLIGMDTLHVWVSHPTPPVFDGPEDRNGRRNFDEIRFWVLYLEGSEELVDDAGARGGYGSRSPFVIAGDLNARPADETVVYDGVSAIDQLLEHPRIQDPDPTNRATASWLEGVRVDYVLPSSDLSVRAAGVVDPVPDANPTVARAAQAASDHRLVWVDIVWPPTRPR
jgi:endonuclease/exonuclease/phosphatase family metal-dependent hydrolase